MEDMKQAKKQVIKKVQLFTGKSTRQYYLKIKNLVLLRNCMFKYYYNSSLIQILHVSNY